LNNPRAHIARLAPLLPQLVLAFRRRSGEIPESLKRAGRHGERHIQALISLAITGPATVSALAERLEISTANASLVVGELARAGLVQRDHDERDRRRIVVSLSETTKPAVAEMRARNAGPLLRFLSELDDREAETFIDHLTTLISYLRDETPLSTAPDSGSDRPDASSAASAEHPEARSSP
jgi:DNA-binding MarR family transcriptional regulator